MNELEPRHDVEIVEVGPRDGFQNIGPFIETATKLAFVERAAEAGFRRMEVGSFVSAAALPQLADSPQILAASRRIDGLLPQILVPSERRGVEAIAAGAPMLSYVLSLSESHNRNNVRRAPLESAGEYQRLMAATPAAIPVRLNIATTFDCPFEGRMEVAPLLDLLGRLVPMRADVELALCDTTGRAVPDQVRRAFGEARGRFPDIRHWAFHAHDTYGLGAANVFAAYEEGVRVFDAAFGGLGGCPFAPGATGNVASEDLVWMFERMGVSTGIDLARLSGIAADAADLPCASPGGRVREALRLSRSLVA